jgi:HEAT repeat protein
MIAYEDTKEGLLDLRDNLSKFISTLFPASNSIGTPNRIAYQFSHEDREEDKEEQRFELLSSVSHKKHYAIKFLGDCKDAQSYDKIKRISEIEKNPDILRDTFVALYKINPEKAKPALLSALWQNDYLVRERIVTILGNYEPDKQLINSLKAQLSDSSWGVRRAVCEVFGKWEITDDEELKSKLLSMLNDDEPFVRFSAREALEKISTKAKESIVIPSREKK